MNSSNEDKIVSPASCHQLPILAPTGRRDNVKRLFALLQQKTAGYTATATKMKKRTLPVMEPTSAAGARRAISANGTPCQLTAVAM
jgi:hypothetical protein